jgi:Flp pilus assembly protein TadD
VAVVAASSSAIPWDDLAPATAKTCEELAPVGVGTAGPKGFLLQQAVTSAQRALMQGDTAAAHAAFCTAAQLGVPSDTVLLGLTQVLLMQSDVRAALKAVDQLLERAPSNKAALDWRGDILVRMGRVDEAKQAWFKAAGASRASKPLIDNLVRASDADVKLALRSGDLSRADRMLRRVIALTSGDPEHCRQLVAVLTKSGNAAAEQRWRTYLSTLGG